MARILLLVSNIEFDPTEASVPWKIATEAGHDVWFASEDRRVAICDQITLTGQGLAKHLQNPKDFIAGPKYPAYGSAKNPNKGFYVRDRHLLSARWPGDCYKLAHAFCEMLAETS